MGIRFGGWKRLGGVKERAFVNLDASELELGLFALRSWGLGLSAA